MKKTARLTITALLGLGVLLGVAAPASAAEPKSISEQIDELTVIYPGEGHHQAIDFGDEFSGGGGEFSLPEPGSIVAGMED